jgi:N-acetylglucosamine kinase-like BadF-type ATPase
LPQNLSADDVTQIYFYGAGCSSDDKKRIVEDGLRMLFVNAIQIQIEHDLLASARALLGTSAGFAAILGTGTNTCIYDGNDCVLNIDSLGYLLGDEGSGSSIGRKVLRSYMRRLWPDDLLKAFENEYGKRSNAEIISEFYANEKPNTLLASYSKFAGNHIQHKDVESIVLEAFREFFTHLVSHYPNYQQYSFNCVGSIAVTFSKQLKTVAEEFEMSTGKLIQAPLHDLVNYHIALGL